MKPGGVISESDYTSAQYLHMRPRRPFVVLGAIIVLLLVVASVLSRSWLLFSVSVGLIGWYYLYIPWCSKRSYRQYKAISRPFEIELTEDGYKTTGENGEGTIPWGDFIKFRQSDDVFLLYPSDNMFYVVPQHFFDSRETFEGFVVEVKRRTAHAA